MNILEARRRVLGGEVYKKTAEGNPASVRSLARMRPGLSIMGKSTQKTTTGAQLFDGLLEVGDISGSDGSLLPSDTVVRTVNYISLSAGIYTLTSEGYNGELFVKVYDTDNNYIRQLESLSINKGYSFSIDELCKIKFNTHESANGNTDMKFMLNKGSTSLPWEPYTGGHPSPSPDYPQEIHSAGEDGSIQVYVTGANLADVDNAFVDGHPDESPEKIENGFILNAVDSAHRLIRIPCKTKKGNKYTFKFDYEKLQGNENALLSIVLQGGGGASQYIPIGGTVVCNSDRENFCIYTDSNNIGARFKVTNVICNQGDTIYPYEPYKQPQSLTVQTPNGLPGIPVTSGGNYTDSDGQQWICDEIDFKRGKYVQRVRVLNARDVTWSDYWNGSFPDESGNTHVFNTFVGEGNRFKGTNAFCSHFRLGNIITPDNGYNIFATNQGNGDIGVRVSSKLASTVEEWSQFIQQNDVIFTCAPKTPTETDLSEEQMQAYANLHTNNPTTVVSATDGAGLEITYKTKKSLEVT